MSDPLSEIVGLLQPRAVLTRPITGAGRWAVRFSPFGQPSFAAILAGECRLAIDGGPVLELRVGDFVLLPATPGFVLSSPDAPAPVAMDPHALAASTASEVRYGDPDGPPDMRHLGGYFEFDSPDPTLLVSLLPGVVHVREADRLAWFVRILEEEGLAQLPGHAYVSTRLIELMLIEALRAACGEDAPPGLLRGLADARLAPALRHMHQDVSKAWTMEALANVAALSRSSFFERFRRTVGLPPMEYLLAWRMALAKALLRNPALGLSRVAEMVGYSSASTFSMAFSRYVGEPPSQFSRQLQTPPDA
ncbi:MAG TPA: AraC family transcriptional regulator [Dokdonella sp.]